MFLFLLIFIFISVDKMQFRDSVLNQKVDLGFLIFPESAKF